MQVYKVEYVFKIHIIHLVVVVLGFNVSPGASGVEIAPLPNQMNGHGIYTPSNPSSELQRYATLF